MHRIVMLLAAAGIATLTSATVYANEEAETLIQACEQQTQGAPDQYAAVMQCLDEKLDYETE